MICSSSTTSPCTDRGKYLVAVDIDGVLCRHPQLTPSRNEETYCQIEGGGVIFANNLNHLIPSGIPEFLAWLYSKFTVTIFSAGLKERNEELIDKLRQKILPQTGSCETLTNCTTILSREHCTASTLGNETLYQKDLSRLPTDSLENAILVDDNPNSSYKGQEDHFLYVPTTRTVEFPENRDSWGQIPIQGTSRDAAARYQQNVYNGEIILLYPEENTSNGWIVVFRKKETEEICHQNLAQTEFPKYCLHMFTSDLIFSAQLHPDREASLRRYIQNHNGLTVNSALIPLTHNRIYYVTGLLFEVLCHAQKTNTTLVSALKEQKSFYGKKVLSGDPSDHPDLYRKGLEVLREKNPKLEFSTPSRYWKVLSQQPQQVIRSLSPPLQYDWDPKDKSSMSEDVYY